MDVIAEQQAPTATVTEISNSTTQVDDVERARTADRATVAVTSTHSPEPARVVATQPVGEISDSEAVGVGRSFIGSRADYGVSSECLSVTSLGYRNAGYNLQASDRCTGRSIGRWRVDSKTREVFRQRPDGRYLRP